MRATEVSEFIPAQQWLEENGTRSVVIPFDDALADLVPAQELRTRRDYSQLLTTIQTIALLHQCQRERTEAGAMVATVEQDYALARRLLAPIFDAVVVEGLTPAIRETIEAIGPGESIDFAILRKRLKRSKGALSERVQKAIDLGYLRNLEPRKGVPAIVIRTSIS